MDEKRIILIVDDDVESLEELSGLLAQQGYGVYQASDGQTAIDILCDNDCCVPDLIITDIHMPGISGVEMIEKARRMGFDVPVLVMSATSDSETLQRLRDSGAIRGFSRKPINLKALFDMIEEVFSKRNGGVDTKSDS